MSHAFSTVIPEAKSQQKLQEAAYLIYYTFWGKNLDDILHPVPDNGNFKHLTRTQIISLGMEEKLLYPGEVLLVREEYSIVYHDLFSLHDDEVNRGGGVVITGQPGSGN